MNDFVPLVEVDELPADLRADYDTTDRPGLRDFIRMMANAPDHFRRYNDVYGKVRFDNHLGARLTELVRLAVAQTTRCQLCMSGRHPTAVAAGLTEEMVGELTADERPHLDAAEEAAVNFALKFATDHTAITDADKAALRAHFTPEQIIELGLLCVMCMVGRFSMLAGIEAASCVVEPVS
jgi:AhpD family alkylhydroperoxidase